MFKKILLGLLLLIVVVVGPFYVIGKGWLGKNWETTLPVAGPRPVRSSVSSEAEPQILFGDLHTHTNYSIDAAVFNTQLIKGIGVVTPGDACDYARYCSSLDFWSINDHAEGLTPRVWAETLDSIRQCNAESGDPANPDMVSFAGWEWSNSEQDNVPSHYGHKNVIFRTWEEGQVPSRPISSVGSYVMTKVPAALVGLISLSETVENTADLGRFMQESKNTRVCPEDVPVKELPDDCREVASTPTDLYRKLDEWGLDSIVIPHGLAWGTTNPLTADFRDQLDEYESRYQKLLETFSGHGSSEVFEDFHRVDYLDDGSAYCPPATENFTPCCRQAAVIARAQCTESGSADCEHVARKAMDDYALRGARKGRKLFPDADLDDWAGCGQLHNTFQPASMYVPRQSTQYNLALGFDAQGQPRRTHFGLIGSTDNHVARPGNTYKELNRPISTDNKSVTGEPSWSYTPDRESGSFYYTGGLVAVHAQGRDRDSIWKSLDNRQVYATSGDRMLVWFDLLNAPEGEAPMGSKVSMLSTPSFRVRALGAFEQQPGCPDYAVAALGKERLQSLCGGECYKPGDRRKAITRIEIIRIRPQVEPGEDIGPLIEDTWKTFDCPADGNGCTVEFEDEEFLVSGRNAVYYARVIQEEEPLIGGDPFGCEYDEKGECVHRIYCIDENAGPEEDCLAPAEPRAWTSPIYVDYRATGAL